MELSEKIDTINRSLRDEFGIDISSGNPIWRVVWSEDQYEKRLGEYIAIGVPEVRLVPKYKQWIKERYVLEQLVLVPDGSDLTSKVSYEPKWTFEDKNGNYLPPKYEAAKFIIELVMFAKGKPVTIHKDPDTDPEMRAKKFKETYDSLFGNETAVGDALAHKYGVVVPGPQKVQ